MNSPTALIDAHVHLHDCYSLPDALDSAQINFCNAADFMHIADPWLGYLMISDISGEAGNMLKQLKSRWSDRFNVVSSDENCSYYLEEKANDNQLGIIMGNQIVTSENIEILVFGQNRNIPNGKILDETISDAVEQGALAILPWGFGKWWSTRGKTVHDVLNKWQKESQSDNSVFIGDSGCRLRYTPEPAQITAGVAKNIWNLPGTDPLPFISEAQSIGSVGFILPDFIDMNSPLKSIIWHLGKQTSQPKVFGAGSGLVRFCTNQFAMQLRKQSHR